MVDVPPNSNGQIVCEEAIYCSFINKTIGFLINPVSKMVGTTMKAGCRKCMSHSDGFQGHENFAQYSGTVLGKVSCLTLITCAAKIGLSNWTEVHGQFNMSLTF
jgi:hypothetical protein